MIGGFGATELLILLGIVLLVFGAGKVPKVGKHLGAGIKNFKDALSNNDDEDNKKLEDQT